MQNSAIEWTDHTFNPWIGCTKVSPGCTNWKQPLRWNKEAPFDSSKQHRPRVFCASLADWLDDEVPIQWLADLLKLIHDTPNLDWLLLTKRPENWYPRLSAVNDLLSDQHYGDERYELRCWVNNWLYIHNIKALGGAPPNVWFGVSTEDQPRADERIPELLKIPARVRFLSVEPILERVDILGICSDPPNSGFAITDGFGRPDGEGPSRIHWVICGGESGSGKRPFKEEWAYSLKDQCRNAGVAFFMKQIDKVRPIPSDLLVRQFPA